MSESYAPEKRGPGRPRTQETRADETQRTRRRRQDTSELAGLNLRIPEELKDPAFEYRWINDTGGRIHAKTKMDDWDKVEGVAPVVVDKTPRSGEPMRAFLCRKPKQLHEEDKAKAQARINEQENSLRRGKVTDPKGLSGADAYVPEGGIVIEDRSRRSG